MKNIQFINILFTLLFFATLGNAQNLRLYNASLTDTSKNYVYIGIENFFVIEGMEDIDQYRIETNGVKLIKITKDTFVIDPINSNDVIIKVWKEKELIIQNKFVAKRIEQSFVTLANSTKSELSIAQILAHPYLDVKRNDYLNGNDNFVSNYKIKFVLGGHLFIANSVTPVGSIDTIPVENPNTGELIYSITYNAEERVESNRILGNSIPTHYLALIKRLQPNDQIIFEEISIVGAMCPRRMPNITITIFE